MAVRRVKPKDGCTNCRLCGNCVERIEHFAECTHLSSTFSPIINLIKAYEIPGSIDRVTLLLGCTAGQSECYTPLPNGIFTCLLVMWKFLILSLTELDTSESKFSSERVWSLTAARLAERLNAAQFSFQARVRRAELRDRPPPKTTRINEALEPLVKADPRGCFHYSEPFLNLLKSSLGDKLRLDISPTNTGTEPAPPRLEPIKFVKASH